MPVGCNNLVVVDIEYSGVANNCNVPISASESEPPIDRIASVSITAWIKDYTSSVFRPIRIR